MSQQKWLEIEHWYEIALFFRLKSSYRVTDPFLERSSSLECNRLSCNKKRNPNTILNLILNFEMIEIVQIGLFKEKNHYIYPMIRPF